MRKQNGFIGAMNRSNEGKRALTAPDDTIQNHAAQLSSQATRNSLRADSDFFAIARALARHAAEDDFRLECERQNKTNEGKLP